MNENPKLVRDRKKIWVSFQEEEEEKQKHYG